MEDVFQIAWKYTAVHLQKDSWFSLFAATVLFKVPTNTELVITGPLLLSEI